MKKKVFYIFVISILLLFQGQTVFAKRGEPPVIEPIIYRNIKIVVPNSTKENMGVVQAYDTRTGKLIWSKKLYIRIIYPFVEEDTQYDFIQSMKLENKRLILITERGKVYEVNPETGRKTQGSRYFYVVVIAIIFYILAIVFTRKGKPRNT